jgi:Glycosyltransferase (GlcNAc)/2OG-Fe(II) oxygenase superfamily
MTTMTPSSSPSNSSSSAGYGRRERIVHDKVVEGAVNNGTKVAVVSSSSSSSMMIPLSTSLSSWTIITTNRLKFGIASTSDNTSNNNNAGNSESTSTTLLRPNHHHHHNMRHNTIYFWDVLDNVMENMLSSPTKSINKSSSSTSTTSFCDFLQQELYETGLLKNLQPSRTVGERDVVSGRDGDDKNTNTNDQQLIQQLLRMATMNHHQQQQEQEQQQENQSQQRRNQDGDDNADTTANASATAPPLSPPPPKTPIRGDKSLFVSREYRQSQPEKFQTKHPYLHRLIECLTQTIQQEFGSGCYDGGYGHGHGHDVHDSHNSEDCCCCCCCSHDDEFKYEFDFDMTSVQIAMYPGDGVSGYIKHCDRGQQYCHHEDLDGSNDRMDDDDDDVDDEETMIPQRLITCVYYLTDDDWDATDDGGALRIFHHHQPAAKTHEGDDDGNDDDGDTPTNCSSCTYTDVIPYRDRLVVFRSDKVEHQVMPSIRRPRIAITIWFYGVRRRRRFINSKKKKTTESKDDKIEPAIQTSTLTTTSAVNIPSPLLIRSTSIADNNNDSAATTAARIFVSIASYRDSELVPTLQSMLQTAHKPNRIAIGIVLQLDLHHKYDQRIQNELDDFVAGVDVKTEIRVLRVDANLALGPCYARGLCQTLWRPSEQYVLQIDSHMRFRHYWDTYLIETHTAVTELTKEQHQQQHPSSESDLPVIDSLSTTRPGSNNNNKGVILTTYPAGYTLPNTIQNNETRGTYLVPWKFDENGMLRQRGRLLARKDTDEDDDEDEDPVPLAYRHYLYAGGFNFGTSQACIHNVPYDTMGLPYLFFGEELSMAVRFFTNGYNMYAPLESVVYHLWSRDHRPPTTSTTIPGKPSSDESHIQQQQQQKKKSQQKVHRQLLGDESEIRIAYGLGDARTCAEFAEALGVDFKDRVFTKDDAGCGTLTESDFVSTAANHSVQDIGDGGGSNDEESNNEVRTAERQNEKKKQLHSKVAALDPKSQALIGKFLLGMK